MKIKKAPHHFWGYALGVLFVAVVFLPIVIFLVGLNLFFISTIIGSMFIIWVCSLVPYSAD